MNFENRVGETERQGDADGGMKPLGEKIKDFVDGVKETPREAVRNISHAAGQAKDQAIDYVEHTTVRGVAEDVARLIRRYPVQSLLVGMAFGYLASRRRGD